MKSATDVLPIICLDDDGNKFKTPSSIKGEASLWMEEFRGEVTATMVYDGQPIHDHFKKIDDNAVMGNHERQGRRRQRPLRVLLPRTGLDRLAMRLLLRAVVAPDSTTLVRNLDVSAIEF